MKRTVLSCLPLLPIVVHWLLPVSIENSMYLKIGGVFPFFILNICYFIYIFNYKTLIDDNEVVIPYKARISTIIFIVIYLLYSLTHGILNGIDNLLVLMTNNQVFVYSLLVFILHPMDADMIERTKYIVIPVAIILSIEVLLYSLGILNYSLDLHSEASEGVMRISTTIDAATGSAIVFVMLGVMILYYSDIKLYIRLSVLILITVSIFFLQSIGSVLVWLGYILYYFYVNYLKEQTLSYKIKSLLLGGILIFCFFKTDVYQPILGRYNELEKNDNIGTGRGALVEKAMNIFFESGGFGVGLGQTNYDKSLHIINVKRSHPIGVHNYYICILAELGFWGLFFLLTYLISLIRHINFSNPISFYILLLFGITFCLEPIFLSAEFTMFVVFMLMVSMKKQDDDSTFGREEFCCVE